MTCAGYANCLEGDRSLWEYSLHLGDQIVVTTEVLSSKRLRRAPGQGYVEHQESFAQAMVSSIPYEPCEEAFQIFVKPSIGTKRSFFVVASDTIAILKGYIEAATNIRPYQQRLCSHFPCQYRARISNTVRVLNFYCVELEGHGTFSSYTIQNEDTVRITFLDTASGNFE